MRDNIKSGNIARHESFVNWPQLFFISGNKSARNSVYCLLDLQISVPVFSLQYNTTQLTEAEMIPYSSVMTPCVVGNKITLERRKEN